MGRLIARKGDSSSHGAVIVFTNQDGTVFCEGKEVAVYGAELATHYTLPVHPLPRIIENLATKLFVNSKAVVLNDSIADPAICGATIIAGSSKTFGS